MQWCVGRSTIQIWRGGVLASEKISELSSLLKIGVSRQDKITSIHVLSYFTCIKQDSYVYNFEGLQLRIVYLLAEMQRAKHKASLIWRQYSE